MTLQLSGPMSIADINTELERSPTAQLSTDDPDLLLLADRTAGQTITIPDDLYGKKWYGSIRETVTVNVGTDGFTSPSYGYSDGSGFGTRSPTTYRGKSLRNLYFFTNAGVTYYGIISVQGNNGADYVTALNFSTDGAFYEIQSWNYNSSTGLSNYLFSPSASTSPLWGSGDVGVNKSVTIYGK